MRYFLELRYNGGAYCGWQRQPDMPTVQQTLERSLTVLLRQSIEVTGAGRTDTGVNAAYYVAHFDCAAPVEEPERTVYKLNFLLPDDISVARMTPVADGRTPGSMRASASTATTSRRAKTPSRAMRRGSTTCRWTWRG